MAALGAATATCREALTWSAQRGPRGRADEGMVLVSLADLLRERNELDEALARAVEAVKR